MTEFPVAAGFGRIPITALSPAVPAPFAPKGFVGEAVPFAATIFREGHDLIGADLEIVAPSGAARRHRMRSWGPKTDRFRADAVVDEPGHWTWRVTAFGDDWATWRHVADVKLPIGQDVAVTLQVGVDLLKRAAAEAHRPAADRERCAAAARIAADRRGSVAKRTAALVDPALDALFDAEPLRSLITSSPDQSLVVERTAAGVGAWYEFFPRSEGAVKRKDGSWKSGTFRTAADRLPAVAAMGFDVVYLPPIHPIGEAFRKGPNNTLTAAAGDPGSPWAIGSSAGGHDSIHPDLGGVRDFVRFVRTARELGLEVALDLALQASPDHPWVSEHPEWFTVLPDGTIAYAENPPKKYQDIYPVNFDRDPEGIFAEVLRIVELWIERGIRIFRVDNPHTKPLAFWQRLIAAVNADHPDVVFLAEAFTRPAMMQALALAGFQQSYTYYPWKNTKAELTEFLEDVTLGTTAPPWEPHGSADFLRPSLWVTTPDILTEYLQFGGKPAFLIRAAVAALAAPLWGVYAGYELVEQRARPGAEEHADNEKYEYRPRDWAGAEERGESLAPYLTRLNGIRREHPALRQLRNLTVHWCDDDRVLVFVKHLPAELSPTGVADTVAVVANLDPYAVVETRVHFDPRRFGMASDAAFTATDLFTGEERTLTASDNPMRLDPWTLPVLVYSLTPATTDPGVA